MKRAVLATLAASGVAAAIVTAVVLLGPSDEAPIETATSTSTSSASSTSATTTSTTTTTTPSTTTTTIAPTTTTTTPALRPGSAGPAVLAVEQRLDSLGYVVGSVDGVYDSSTAHGVTAFQKLQGLGRDGVVGPATEAALAVATAPAPRTPSGRILEIDLAHQVLLVVEEGRVHKVLDVSTGQRPGLTPTGHFTIYRQIDGWRHAPLGVLYRPKYFYRGLAIHGFSTVPSHPASHGCVRVTNAEMDLLWTLPAAALGQPVWIY